VDSLAQARDIPVGGLVSASIERVARGALLRLLTGERKIRLTRTVPSRDQLREKFAAIDTFGLYVHIPFCEQICPYCPYNKELYRGDLAAAYVGAMKREIDLYSDIVGGKPVTSLYIGGGTPTTMLHGGLGDIIGHLREAFDLRCDIHMESHPNHLSDANLSAIASMGVQHLSMGVEALADRHLKTLCRPYTADQAKEAMRRALTHGFKCVNVDVMFALPGQTYQEVEETGHELVELGVDQVAAYPLFLFPYTPMGRTGAERGHVIRQSLRRREMMRLLEGIFHRGGYERTSAWAFTKRGVPRYCSVTVPLYVGLGASGGSYLKDVFYLNTFRVGDYVRALESGRMGIALSVDLTERMQRAGWLYWRIYETRFRKTDYQDRFGEDLDSAYGRYLRPARRLGLLKDDGERIALSDSGAFWLHACEDLLSIDFVSQLWGASQREPWPERAVLS
jgi:coproporphyrinogen III oxidase-like Fe-S oxidoreductase